MTYVWKASILPLMRCCTCHQPKPPHAFAWRNKAKNQRARDCRACHSKARRANYAANRARDVSYVNRRRRSLRAWLKAYKATLHCKRCGENHPATLDFHHRNPRAKEIAIHMIYRKGWGKARILKEIKKCDVLCANCHRKEHWTCGPSIDGYAAVLQTD